MIATALGEPVLPPHPHLARVAVVSAAVGHTIVLHGHAAPITGLAPGARLPGPLGRAGGCRPRCCGGPPGGGWLVLSTTCHSQGWILLPVINLTISPPKIIFISQYTISMHADVSNVTCRSSKAGQCSRDTLLGPS